MLLILVGVKLYNIGDLAVAETLQTLASLGVPKLHLTVITT